LTQTASITELKIAAPPRANSDAHYVVWLQELSELRDAGMMPDEDFAFARAERLEELFEVPPKPWRKWLFVGVPVALLAGGTLAYFQETLEHLFMGGAIATLCVIAAIGTHSRVMSRNLSHHQKLAVLRSLLERDLISADEFSVFEHRIAEA
jgi:hypothetical protein